MNQIDLSGQRAVITGGARGIGRAIAERFLASGASVALWDQDAERLGQTVDELSSRGAVHQSVVDITDEVAVAGARDEALEKLGGIEIVVNNAGITGPNLVTWEYPPDEFRHVLDVDLTAVFLVCRALVPHLKANNYGRIVNIASVAGKEGNPNAVAYSAAKAGVIALTKSLGKELANTEITVNCVTPAAAETEMFQQMSAEHIAYMRAKIPKNRFLQIEEVAALVAWLASRECSFSTGAVFDISGGRSTY